MVKRLRAAMCRTINVRQGQSMPQEYPQASLLAQPLSWPWSFDREFIRSY
jgi:hypothetical protein